MFKDILEPSVEFRSAVSKMCTTTHKKLIIFYLDPLWYSQQGTVAEFGPTKGTAGKKFGNR